MVVEAAEPEPSGSIANPAATTSPSLSHRFLDSKFYLLVVVGEIVTEEHLRRAIGNIELGIRSWDTNLIECNLDQELKLLYPDTLPDSPLKFQDKRSFITEVTF